MPELRLSLTDKANQNVILFMGYYHIKTKAEAATRILEAIKFPEVEDGRH